MPSHPRYFSGTSVTGSVSAAPFENFAGVIEKLNICPQLPLTRKAFLALPKAERQTTKHVPFLIAAVMDQSPSPRTTEHALHCNLLFVDIDELPDGKCPAAPFVRNPDLLYQALEGFSFAAHTTASSTPEKPRMRVIVEADEISVADYPRAVNTIAAMLGLPSVTKESRIAVMPMFLPTQFKGDTEENHPLLGSILAKAFCAEHIQDTPDFYTSHRNGNTRNGSVDDLDFLRAPVPEITLAIAKDALSHIDPDVPYEEWFAVAAALRHQFSPHEADEAYELFDEWSSTGGKYAGEDDTRKKWDSLKPTPIGRMPITIHTLLKAAVHAGWDDSRLREKGYNAIGRWMDTVESISELMEQGIRRILAQPQLTNTQEGMLLEQLRSTAKARFGHRASITDLRKDMARLREVQKPEEKKKKEPRWAKGLCFVTSTKEFYRPLNGEKYKPDSFNMKYARQLLPTPQSLIAAGMPVNESTLSRPLVEPSDYVMNFLKLPTFYNYEYVPSQPNEMLFVHEGRKYVNTYAPTYPEADEEKAEEAGTLFQHHLSNLVAEPSYRGTLIDFLAYQVQFPGQKVRWAPLIQGAEGAGKTYLCEVMKAVLGQRHVKLADGTTIKTGWNEWAHGFQMVFIEEIRVQGTNRFDIMNRLKPWITNDAIPLNEKFQSSRDVINITNYVLFSNHHDALALTQNDRRYFVVKSPLQTAQQVLALGTTYFDTLFGFLHDHPGAMRSWLLNWRISDSFNANGRAPRTKYVEEMIADTASDTLAAIRRLLSEGDHPLTQYDIVSASVLTNALALEDGLGRVSGQDVSHVLKEEGFQSVGRHLLPDGNRHYLWARNGVSDAVGKAIDRVEHDKKNLHMELLF